MNLINRTAKNKLISASLLLLSPILLAEPIQRPNIVYILADDLGYGDVASFNSDSKIATPNLDQLAKQGIRFTDMHTNSSVCTPTRYGILTGRYAWRTELKKGVVNGHSKALIKKGRETIASFLKKQNYATAAIGKWHLGLGWKGTDNKNIRPDGKNVDIKVPLSVSPVDHGFDYYYGIAASLNMSPHAYIENRTLLGDLKFYADKKATKAIGLTGAKAGWVDSAFKQDQVMGNFIDKTIDWIATQNKNNPKQPFFTYLALNAPHSPIVPNKDFLGKSGLSTHGDFTMEMDHQVGRLIKALDKMGLADNTLVIFTADNGVSPMAKLKPMQAKGHDSTGKYRGLKGSLYEGGHRVPFIARWPDSIKQGLVTDYHGSTTDLFASIADILSVKLADSVAEDSVSFIPALTDTNYPDSKRGGVVYHSDAGFYSIRNQQWKLILHEQGGTRRHNPKDLLTPVKDPFSIQLFNLSQDPEENINLQAEFPQQVEQLKSLLASYISQGRSTAGKPQQNEAPNKNKEWTGIKLLKNYLDKS